MRTDVLDVGFDGLALEEVVMAGAALVKAGGSHYAVTPSPGFLLAAKHSPAFRQALPEIDPVLADGMGVAYSAKILGRPPKGEVPGIDFAQRLLAWMARHGKQLFLLGVKPSVAELATINLEDAHPSLIVCSTHDGYFREDGPVVEEIRAIAADMVFVCLGAPKQELWMMEHGPATDIHSMVGPGGSLDVFTDVVERAPGGFQRSGLEWLYRLAKEPKRIGRTTELPLVLARAAGARLWGK